MFYVFKDKLLNSKIQKLIVKTERKNNSDFRTNYMSLLKKKKI